MSSIRVRVENGKIIGDAPPGFRDGEELELSLVDPGNDLTDDELAKLNSTLEEAWRAVQKGLVRPARQVVDEIRATR